MMASGLEAAVIVVTLDELRPCRCDGLFKLPLPEIMLVASKVRVKEPERFDDCAIDLDGGDFFCRLSMAFGRDLVKVIPGEPDVSIVDQVAPRRAEQIFHGVAPLFFRQSERKTFRDQMCCRALTAGSLD